ncbi:uncharacterized protein [Pyrus communis]|uniref:uncharacterized protein isoform X1 n=1 Tax=Pyrus communis TaxID=23211 RepID=UPI0035BFE127
MLHCIECYILHPYKLRPLVCWSPGYAALPQVQRHMVDSSNTESSGEACSGQSQPQLAAPGGPAKLSFSQFPPYVFVPGANVAYGERSGSDPNLTASQLEAQKKFLQHQIELILQNQLQLLQKPKPKESVHMGPTRASLDGKGKSVAASSSASDCGRHEDGVDS